MKLPALLISVLPLAAFSNAQLIANPIASGLSQLTGAYGDQTDANRFYATQKTGQLVRVDSGVATTVVNVSTLIDNSGERGLLGFVQDPNFSTNGWTYISYVNNQTKALDVVRLTNFNLGTAEAIISIPHPTNANNHYGGNIRFGTDGMLYIAMGDGGGSNDPENDAQNLNNFLGKIMRIDVSAGGTGYSVPNDNPFVGIAGLDEIWAYGLRNPFKFSFDTNGDLFIADVGQNAWEEVNQNIGNIGGVNYGWQALEGTHANPNAVAPPAPNATPPIFEYNHSEGRSITGGVVYHGTNLGSTFQGRYFFGDFISQRLWSIDPDSGNISASLLEHTSGLGANISFTGIEADANGELLLTSFGGTVYRLEAVPEPGTMILLATAASALFLKQKEKVS